MKSLSKKQSRAMLVTAGSILLAVLMVLSGVGIYFKLNKKEKTPAVVTNPLDFSVDVWDGSTSASAFNEAYAGRSVKTKTINAASAFAHFVNEVNNGNSFEGYTVYLNSNIDFAGQEIDSIGTATNPFKGTFDGGHYTILNAKFNGTALFENAENANIKNVGLYNAEFLGDTSANAKFALVNRAINTNIENTFVRLGHANLVNEFISNDGPHYIKNSFVDSDAKNLINKLDTNNSSENEVSISSCYFTLGETAVAEKVGECYVKETNVINASTTTFAGWSYSKEYDTNTEWCDYDFRAGSDALEFNYPLQAGFVKVYLTGSCYESVVVAGDTIVDASNMAKAFEEANKTSEAEINLLVEKVFMEARAEATNNTEVKVNAIKDTTIVRGDNNEDSMFVSTGNSKITLGSKKDEISVMSTEPETTLTLDGNREYVEKNNLESGALVVSYGGEVEINENVVIKDNINNTVGYGGAILLYNTAEKAKIDGLVENCHAENGGGALCAIGVMPETAPSATNCSTNGKGGAIYLTKEIDAAGINAIRSQYKNSTNIEPLATDDLDDEDFYLANREYYGDYAYGGYGGAICVGPDVRLIFPSKESEIVVFEECGSPYGAIYFLTAFDESGDPFLIQYASFINCGTHIDYEDGNGGAICFGDDAGENSVLFGDGLYFSDCHATAGSDETGIGGAIYAPNQDLIFNGQAVFENCSSDNAGGAIYAQNVTITGDVAFTNCSSSNAGSGGGGAIYASSNVDILDTNSLKGDMVGGSQEVLVPLSGDYDFIIETSFNTYYPCENLITLDANGSRLCVSAGYNGVYVGLDEIPDDPQIDGVSEDSDYYIDMSTGNGYFFVRLLDYEYELFGECRLDMGSFTWVDGLRMFIGDTNARVGEVKVSESGVKNYIYNPTRTSFVGNYTNDRANGSGGAIYAGGDVFVSSGAVFSNNDSLSYGGAIYAGGDVEISSGAKFEANEAEDAGGAIHSQEGDVIISGAALFEDNNVVMGGGGAIVSLSGDVIVTEASSFISNSSGYEGGAIYAAGDVLIAGNATFESNTVRDSDGGAIYSIKNVTISGDATFMENSSWDNGGAICTYGSVTISGSPTFTENSSGSSNIRGYGSGGAIYASGDVTISGGATFIGNTAGVGGGAIYAAGNVLIAGDATFERNTVRSSSGGAIYANGKVIISGAPTFTGNTATSSGGAIYAGGAVLIDNSLTYFDVNESLDTDLCTSGYNQDFKIETTFMLPVGYEDESHYYTILHDSTIGTYVNIDLGGHIGVTLGGAGGVSGTKQVPAREVIKLILEWDVDTEKVSLKVYDVETNGARYSETLTCEGDRATLCEGIRIAGSEYEAIFIGEFKYTDKNGTQIFNSKTITSVPTFTENSAEGEGGAIYTSYGSGDVTISADAKFTDNEANGNGGAILCGGNLVISGDAEISGTKAGMMSAIYASKKITISGNPIFRNNSCGLQDSHEGRGGAISCNGGLEITGAPQFISNSSVLYGGAIAVENGETIISGNAKFMENSTENDGGAIYANGDVTISGDVEFTNNRVIDDDGEGEGGAIYTEGSVTISGDATFTGNSSSGNGGAIYASGDVIISGDVAFSSNSASLNGGAIYAGGSVTINDEHSENEDLVQIGSTGIQTGFDIDWSKDFTMEFDCEYQLNGINQLLSAGSSSDNTYFAIYFDNSFMYVDFGEAGNFYNDSTLSDFGKAKVRISYTASTQLLSIAAFDEWGNGTSVWSMSDCLTTNMINEGSKNLVIGKCVENTISSTPKMGEVKITQDEKTYVFNPTSTLFVSNHADGKGGAINAGGDVTISSDAKFTDNEANGNGGAIYAFGNATISGDATFTENSASDGGAIWSGVDVTISGEILFRENENAIYADGDVTILSKVNFLDNGMAILTDYGDVNISGDIIVSSSAPDYIHRRGIQGANINISGNAVFENLRGMFYGTAIFSSGNVTLSGNATFRNNEGEYGGAIHATNVIISGNPTFEGNVSTGSDGGAICANINVIITGAPTFTGNTSSGDGGAIYAGGDVTISGDATFTGNEAGANGGAINAGGNVATSTLTYMAPNTEKSIELNFNSGDAFTVEAEFMLMCDASELTSNSIALFIDDSHDKTLTEGVYIHNGYLRCINDDGSFDSTGTKLIPTCELLKLYITRNDSGPYQTIRIVDSATNGNIFSDSVQIQNWCSLIDSAGSNDNNVPFLLGALKITDSNGTKIYNDTNSITTDVTFTNNDANSGGAIYVVGDIDIGGNATFTENKASTGGAIYAGSNVSISGNPIFSSNGSSNGGYSSAILCNGEKVVIAGSPEFRNNNSDEGGAIRIADGIVKIEAGASPKFIENIHDGTGPGGAIYANAVTISGEALFEGNSANGSVWDGGGAIWTNTFTTNSTANVQFKNNEAKDGSTSKGGAVCCTTANIAGTVLFENNNSYLGGAIYAGGSVTISGDATFTGNTASSGGAIYVSGDLTISGNATFTGNSANDGGAIWTNGNVTIKNATFTGPGGYYGSAITGENVTLTGTVSISGFSTSGDPAAIYAGSTITIESAANVTISNCFAGSSEDSCVGGIGAENLIIRGSLNISTSSDGVGDIRGNVTFEGANARINEGAIINLGWESSEEDPLYLITVNNWVNTSKVYVYIGSPKVGDEVFYDASHGATGNYSAEHPFVLYEASGWGCGYDGLELNFNQVKAHYGVIAAERETVDWTFSHDPITAAYDSYQVFTYKADIAGVVTVRFDSNYVQLLDSTLKPTTISSKTLNAGETYTVNVKVLKAGSSAINFDFQPTNTATHKASTTEVPVVGTKKAIPEIVWGTGKIYYDGTEHTVLPTNWNSLESYVDIINNKRTNVGSQTITLRLKDPTSATWADGSIEDKLFTMTVEAGRLSAPTNVEFNNYIVSWDAVEMPGVNVSYRIMIAGGTLSDFTTTVSTSETTFDIKSIIKSIDAKNIISDNMLIEVYAISDNHNLAADSFNSDFYKEFWCATFVKGTGIADILVNNAAVGEGQLYFEGEEIQLSVILEDGYQFDRWSENVGYLAGDWDVLNMSKTLVLADPSAARDITATALPTGVTATFLGNGGNVEYSSKVYDPAGTYGELPTAFRTGYNFQGWKVGEVSKNLFDVESATTLFRNGSVQETKTSTGYVLTNANTTSNFVVVKFGNTADWIGKTLTLSYKSTNNGDIKWVYCDEDGENRSVQSGNTITIDNTRACFGFRINASTTDKNMVFEFSEIQIEEGSTATSYSPHYVGTGSILTSASEVVDTDHVLVAQWQAKTFTVTFDLCGQYLNIDPSIRTVQRTVTYGQAYGSAFDGLSESDMQVHYMKFTGWFTSQTGGIEITADTIVTALSNHTLYAQGEYRPCDVEFTCDLTLGTLTGDVTDGWGGYNYAISKRPTQGDIIVISGNVLNIGSAHIVATPKESTAQYEYRFVQWQGVSNGQQIYSGGYLTITAVFERVTRKYTVKVDLGSSVTELQVDYGTAVKIEGNKITIGNTTLTASQTGKTFSKWVGAVGVINGAVTIVADFSESRIYELSFRFEGYVEWSINGEYVGNYSSNSLTVYIPSGTVIDYGENGYTLTINGDTYEFRGDSGSIIQITGPEMIKDNATILIKEIPMYNLEIEVDGINKSCNISVQKNSKITLQGMYLWVGNYRVITLGSDYTLSNIVINGTPYSGSLDGYVITENTVITMTCTTN